MSVQLSCDVQLSLETGGYSAKVAPSAGGRISELTWRSRGRSHDLLLPWDGKRFDSHSWPKAGAFPMLPFTNRLPESGFVFRGRRYRPVSGPNGFPVHGFMHRMPWQVLAATKEYVEMYCMHEGDTEGWPWPFSALQQVSLTHGGISVTFTLTNLASESMPVALGWHPYHPISANASTDDISFSATRRHDLDIQGKAIKQDDCPIFRMEPDETAAFTGWKGEFMFRAAHGFRIRVVGEGWQNLVLHRPGTGNYLCVEPTTLLPGHLGDDGTPFHVIEPGASRRAAWSCGVCEQ